MARKPRFHVPGALYHVMLRGNGGQDIFFSHRDRCKMCLLIQEGQERFRHSIHAFCFMSNHVHLAIQVNEASVSRIMQHLAFRYAQYINRRQHRLGHLFQGRFKSVLVDDAMYFKELVRYIHMNPVQAKLVQYPEDYAWSSHTTYLAQNEVAWLTCDRLLREFGESGREARMRFDSFVRKEVSSSQERFFELGDSNGLLGQEPFIHQTLRSAGALKDTALTLSDLVSIVCRRYTISENELCCSSKRRESSRARAVLAFLVSSTNNLSIEQLARCLNRAASGVSRLAQRLQTESYHSNDLARELQELQGEMRAIRDERRVKCSNVGV